MEQALVSMIKGLEADLYTRAVILAGRDEFKDAQEVARLFSQLDVMVDQMSPEGLVYQ